jgi:misacylated tRNA(Ala) deacylase
MTKHLYFEDSYLKDFSSVVLRADGNRVVLAESAFYPGGGGQPCDLGTIADAVEHRVISVSKDGDDIVHEIEGTVSPGTEVHCTIDWDRRQRLMRMHTAAHVLSAVIHAKTGALITGNQLGVEQSRIDFSLEDFDREKMLGYCDDANRLIAEGREVRSYFTDSSNVQTLLAKGLPEGIDRIRIVEIDGIDTQADGGTHVKNTAEIGRIEIVKIENKGKHNRRVYYVL